MRSASASSRTDRASPSPPTHIARAASARSSAASGVAFSCVRTQAGAEIADHRLEALLHRFVGTGDLRDQCDDRAAVLSPAPVLAAQITRQERFDPLAPRQALEPASRRRPISSPACAAPRPGAPAWNRSGRRTRPPSGPPRPSPCPRRMRDTHAAGTPGPPPRGSSPASFPCGRVHIAWIRPPAPACRWISAAYCMTIVIQVKRFGHPIRGAVRRHDAGRRTSAGTC